MLFNSEHKQERLTFISMLDTPERQQLANTLLDHQLPRLAADLENELHKQDARVVFESVFHRKSPRIKVIVKLKKQEHKIIIHLDSKKSLCKVGSESGLGGSPADSAESVCRVAKNMMLRVRSI
ncbi:hypothetical protein B9Z35_10350 [Limnohabitans sp. Jir61]|uniref:hypothetical protein n=1 Tax=Limnohabitans sp. Jir61 TaxID=1826168 RepID=UPI000D3A74D8|nr:hypothetical protein [Limnohabitans sp. Jir61]PUE29581.1 hypothetical protein B9Z35_10350 [Limnohabitans sp. Jir61]